MAGRSRSTRLNLAQVLNPVTGRIDADCLDFSRSVELYRANTLEELVRLKVAFVRIHERRLSPGQGKHQT